MPAFTAGSFMDTSPSFPQLTPDDRIWRLDWFGECAYPGSVRRYAQPSIKVVLSSLRSDQTDHSALYSPDSTEHQHPHEAWVPVAALPMLAIGDLWQNGNRISSPDYRVESFRALRIDAESASFVKAGLAVDGRFLLPLSCHPWHRLHTRSYCVSVVLGDDRRLLVPCVELIRFYFGSSGNLLLRLFTTSLTTETLWVSKRFNPANRHLHLVLAAKLSPLSAPDVGRIAESRFAWRAAAGIHASCQKASAQRSPAYPYTGFPFEGVTDLVASGVWLPFGEEERATFLAYRLRSCSHSFPFRSLSYEAADRKAFYSASGRKSGNAGGVSRTKSTSGSETIDADPSLKKAQHKRVFESQQRFPDLERKPIWREKIEALPSPDIYLRHDDGTVEQVAFGEPAGGSDSAGLDVALTNEVGAGEESRAALPWFVRVGLERIASDRSYAPINSAMKVVCPDGKTKQVFSLPEVIDDDGVIDNDSLFTAADGHTRQRQGCFVEVSGQNEKPKFLVILEGANRYQKPEIELVPEPGMRALMDLLVIRRAHLRR